MRVPETGEQFVVARMLRLDRRGALDLLRRMATDRAVMRELRRLYMEEVRRSSIHGLTDDAVLSQLAERIGRGELEISVFKRPERPGPPEGDSSTVVAQAAQAQETAAAKKQTTKEEPPDEMLSSVEAAKQAAVLVQAAQEGVPFCEECTKKKGRS